MHIGINTSGHDAAAAIVGPAGTVIAALSEERPSRQKRGPASGWC